MSVPDSPRFLDLKSYRLKRLIDAAKLLPLLGAAVLLFPLPFFFIASDAAPVGSQNATPLGIYLFVVWLVLIVAALILSRWLRGAANAGSARSG